MTNLSSPCSSAFLWILFSFSTVQAYVWGQVDTNTRPEVFNEGWRPSWRGAEYLGKCMSTQGNAGKLHSFGIITGILAGRNGDEVKEDHNAQGFVFYKSKDCSADGTDQLIVIRTKRDVVANNNSKTLYRGVQVFDMDLINPGVKMEEYNSYEEIGPSSEEWRWIKEAEIPDTEGMMIVYEPTSNGAPVGKWERSVRTPTRQESWPLFNDILVGKLDTVVDKLRVMLQEIVKRRQPPLLSRVLDQPGLGYPGAMNLASGGGIVNSGQGYNGGNANQNSERQEQPQLEQGIRPTRNSSPSNQGMNARPGQVPQRRPSPGSDSQGRPIPGMPSLTFNQGPMVQQNRSPTQQNSQSRQPGRTELLQGVQLDPKDPNHARLMMLLKEKQQRERDLDDTQQKIAQQQALYEQQKLQQQKLLYLQRQQQQQQLQDPIFPNPSRVQVTRLNDLLTAPRFGGSKEPAQTTIKEEQIQIPQPPTNDENRMQEEDVPEPLPQSQAIEEQIVPPQAQNQAIEEELPPENAVEFKWESGTIPEEGPPGTYNQLFGQELEQLPYPGPRRILEINTMMDPLVEELYGDVRDTLNFPIRGWRGVPTSPTLKTQDIYNNVNAFDAPAALDKMETLLDEFFENPPTLIEEMRPYIPYNPAAVWPNSLMPPPELPTLGRYEAPLAEPGSVREIGIEEQEHFPKFFDPAAVAGDMEEEFFNSDTAEDRVDMLDFSGLASRRLTTADRLFQNWRYKGIPILGNLQELPDSYYDPRWTAIEETGRDMVMKTIEDWKKYYYEQFKPVDEAYLETVRDLREQFDELSAQRTAAVAGIEKARLAAEKSKVPKKKIALQEKQAELTREVRGIHTQLENILAERRREDKSRDQALKKFEGLFKIKSDDLKVRFTVWRDLAVYNIARSQNKLMAEFKKDGGSGSGGLGGEQ
ncbi:hypothetical protein TWF694_003639 [Orbilia ellipsospora]|uniref:Uncharacterized protein n=1 Tax=Orbilia ellipsospora TaxID=2528407 RepID=A0AAV9WYT6_9PEZI